MDSVVWYPAEVNTSIRPGWFYHAEEDGQVKALDELMDLYERTVGGNASFLLNLPPDQRGLIHENDARRMRELGERIRKVYGLNLAAGVEISASQVLDEAHCAVNVTDGNAKTYWCPPEGIEQAVLEIDLGTERSFDRIVLKEYISKGQRIEKFRLEYLEGDSWLPFYEGAVVGYKKICRFAEIRSRRIRLLIQEARWCPMLSQL